MFPWEDAAEAGFNDWSVTSLTTLPGWAVFLLTAGLMVAFLVVLESLRKAPWRVKLPLLTLRALGLLCVLALVLEPGVQLQQVSSTPGRVAVLLDVSRSMGLPVGDAPASSEDDPRRHSRLERAQNFLQEARGALASLPGALSLEGAVFHQDVESATFEDLVAAAPQGNSSNIAKALTTAMASKPGRPLAGVLLISDGADNVDLPGNTIPNELREKLRAAGVPIHTFTLGHERGFKDVAVASVAADDFAFVRNPLEVEATISARGFPGMTIPVTLKREGRVIAQTTAVLPDGDGTVDVRFKFEPRDVGEAIYSVEVAEQVGEVLVDNNRRSFTLKIIRDRIRVLQVAGRPSWDVRFLRKLLKENPSVDLISFFILRTPRDQTAVRQEELSLIPFPTRELFTEELGTFDVVIFQNFNFAPYEMGGYLPNVRDFVVNKGGGFAMVGGELSFSEGGYDGTPLADILPVTLPPGRGHYVEEQYTPTVTEAGKRHPILSLGNTDPVTMMQNLPPFEGFNGSVGLQPGSEALLTHPAPRSGPSGQPVLAVREVGKGRTLSLHSDSLWFWALPDAAKGGRGTAHRELWANAIRWLIGDPALSRVRVEAKSGAFDPNEPVVLVVRAFDSGYGPLAGATVDLTLEGVGDNAPAAPTPDSVLPPSNARKVTSLQGETGPEGEWVVRLPSPGPGAYRARVTARAKGAALGTDEDAFLVRSADREIADGAPRPELMAALSELTGGTQIESGDEIAGLQWKVPEGVRVHKRKSIPLWDRWQVALAFALLWGLEWALRRRQGYA
ncbi:MAG: glutamine amidotransferase [Myxococcota bacterium]